MSMLMGCMGRYWHPYQKLTTLASLCQAQLVCLVGVWTWTRGGKTIAFRLMAAAAAASSQLMSHHHLNYATTVAAVTTNPWVPDLSPGTHTLPLDGSTYFEGLVAASSSIQRGTMISPTDPSEYPGAMLPF